MIPGTQFLSLTKVSSFSFSGFKHLYGKLLVVLHQVHSIKRFRGTPCGTTGMTCVKTTARLGTGGRAIHCVFALTALALEDGLNSIEVSWKWWRIPSRCEGREPGEREAAKDSPHTPPRRPFLPSGHFPLQLLYARLIIPDGLQLGGKHDQGENGKQQRLEDEQDKQDDRDCWGSRRTSC